MLPYSCVSDDLIQDYCEKLKSTSSLTLSITVCHLSISSLSLPSYLPASTYVSPLAVIIIYSPDTKSRFHFSYLEHIFLLHSEKRLCHQ